MARPGKLGRFCQALLVAASVIAVSTGAAQAQQGNELEALNRQILDNPQDVDLNLRYARAAEDAGKWRLALVAYERILINDPTNEEARRGYERIRREIEPPYTVTRVEVGARWDSNALNASEDAFIVASDDREATTLYGRLMVANESEFLGRRWRSTMNLDVEDNADIDELDYGYVGVQTGPILYVGPHLAAIPSIGASMSWLNGSEYYHELNAALTVEGRLSGASYWWRARAGYREYQPDDNFFFSTVTENGPYAEIQGGLTKPRVLFERDTLLVAPFVRWSDVDGSVFSFFLFDQVSPGKFFEYGADVNYNYQFTDHIQGSVGVLLRERDFRDSSREDTYIAPQASVTFQDVLPCDCDVRLQYRYRQNDTNDFSAEYDADQVSLALLARF